MVHDPAALERAVAALGPDWRLLQGCHPAGSESRQTGMPLPAVLINHTIGVALLDMAPRITPDAVEQMRGALKAAQFHKTFPGNLPILHRVLTPEHLGRLPDILDYAFSWEAPLTLPHGEAWADRVQQILTGNLPRVRDRDAESGIGPEVMPARRHSTGWVLAGCGIALLIGGGAAFWPHAVPFNAPHAAADSSVIGRTASKLAEGSVWSIETGAATPGPMVTLEPDVTKATMATGLAVAPEPKPAAGDIGSLVPPGTVPLATPEWMNAAMEPLLRLEALPSLTSSMNEAILIADPADHQAELVRDHTEATAFGQGWTPLAPLSHGVEHETSLDWYMPSPAHAPANAPVAVAGMLAPASAEHPAPTAGPTMAEEPPTASWEAGLVATPAPRLPDNQTDGDETRSPVPPAPAEAASGAEAPGTGQVFPAPVAVAPPLPPATLAMLLRRGDSMLALGDVSAARLFYERAAAAGSGEAATALGKTHDPEILSQLGVRSIASDRATAARWYRAALALSDAAAGPLLARLEGQHR
jgi:TPR repeat protein